ncbi:hypothetical protein ACFCXT_10730 [Streptomyces vinaceus]|uniref:hypothetical protein n=1 Tax=Streptomyces vinaceus TaxID=1960 RepID=UPI0035DF437C
MRLIVTIGMQLAEAGSLISSELTPNPAEDEQNPPECPDTALPSPRKVCSSYWGVNTHGWEVRVRNLTRVPITPWYMGSDMVFGAPPIIEPGATGTVTGKRDVLNFGHPADMSIDLRIGASTNVLSVRRDPECDDVIATVHSWGPWDFTFQKCDPTAPLQLVVTRSRRPGRNPRIGLAHDLYGVGARAAASA